MGKFMILGQIRQFGSICNLGSKANQMTCR
jgi:hypothetical protein